MHAVKLELGTEKMIGEKVGPIGWMTFNQPERRNAISQEMRAAAITILEDFEADDAVRVIVMKGAGDKAFISGSDISKGEKGAATPEQLEEQGKLASRLRDRYETLTKPLIAMIQGYCIGGGVATAMHADIRISADDAQFAIPAARLGNAFNWRYTKNLVEIVGTARAKEILMTARRYGADEALQIGLVHQVVPASELANAVEAVAMAIADNSPMSVRAAKFMVNEAAKEQSARDADKIETVRKACLKSADFAEGRRAFNEKRKPVWTGR